MSDQKVPAELQASCDEVNKQWLSQTGYQVEPYLLVSSVDNDWRVRIKHARGVAVEYLKPQFMHGHTLRLLVLGMDRAHDVGFRDGKEYALERLSTVMRQTVLGVGK